MTAKVHDMNLAKLHLVNRKMQDPDLGSLLDDLQVCEDYTNGDRTQSEAIEAADRLAANLRSILGELETGP